MTGCGDPGTYSYVYAIVVRAVLTIVAFRIGYTLLLCLVLLVAPCMSPSFFHEGLP